jgi:hypothetical protein
MSELLAVLAVMAAGWMIGVAYGMLRRAWRDRGE